MSAPTGLCSKLHPGRWCRKTPPKAQKFDGEKLGDAIGRDKPATIIRQTIEHASLPLQEYLEKLSDKHNPTKHFIYMAQRNMSVWLLGTVLGVAGAELYLSSGSLALKKPQQALLLQQAEVKKTTQDGGEGGDKAKTGVDDDGKK